MFDAMLDRYRNSVVVVLANLEVRQPEQQPAAAPASQAPAAGSASAAGHGGGAVAPDAVPASGGPDGPKGQLTPEQMKTTKRNDPCPCGSGKKFKHCHGSVAYAPAAQS